MRREVLGVIVALAAAFLLATLVVPAGSVRQASCAADHGLTGPVGACVRTTTRFLVGWPTALLLPFLPIVLALRLFGRIRGETDRAWLLFLAGSLLVLPVAIGVARASGRTIDPLSGIWGSFWSYYLLDGVGAVGAWMTVLGLLSVLTVLTLAWNPIRMLVGHRPTPGSVPDDRLAALEDEGETTVVSAPTRLPARTAADQCTPSPEEMPAADLSLAAHAVVGDSAATSADACVVPRPARTRKSGGERRVQAGDAVTVTPDDDELPPVDLMTPTPARNRDAGERELDVMGARLMEALRTFRVEGALAGRTTGPVVTQYEVEPAPGVKVRQIANLANDLALAMRTPSIRIVAPIPGRGAVGVEVPNPTPEMVGFRELVESETFEHARAALPIVLGKNLEGLPVIADLAKMPHLLIAGATGAGKSVCVNTIITSLVYRHTPKTLRFLMVDPKMVELSVYNTLPHLRHKVITDNRDAAAVLKWAVLEMNERYELLAANGCRNIQDFNKRVTDGAPLTIAKKPDVAFEDLVYKGSILPYIVVVIDEMADLMMTVQGEVETPIAMLAQKARAIGIHLILATQRPSVNVITGLIKANFPSRIAFRVASQVDSRTILDGAGAEMLLGNGDMLFIPPGRAEPGRLQGAYISSEDTERLMGWYTAKRVAKRQALEAQGLMTVDASEPDILEHVRQQEAQEAGNDASSGAAPGDRDRLFREAAEIVVQHQQGSTSLLQRRMNVGYGRAARIIDQLHEAGILGPANGSKAREVLVGLEEIERLCGPRA